MISLRSLSGVFGPSRIAFPAGAGSGPKTVEVFQLIWTVAGRLEWTWVDGGRSFTLEPGTLLLARPGMYAGWRSCTASRHGYAFFDIVPAPESAGWPLLRRITSGPLPALLDYLLWLTEEPVPEWIDHAEQTLDTVVHMFVSAPLPDAHPVAEHRALAAALDHIRTEYRRRMRPIDMSELAAVACVSKEHLNRLFSKCYGTGVVRALELVRLGHGETMLMQTNLSIAAIARHCGFGDGLHFSKRFRATFGTSPLAYRNGSVRTTPLATAGLARLSRRLSRD